MKIWLTVTLSISLANSAFGQTTTTTPHLQPAPILLRADLPMYPPVWRIAHLTGKVAVLVSVKNGRVVDAAVKSGEAHLRVPTVANLKTWRFADTVNDQFTVTYSYQISGKPTDNPTNPRIEMLPSLDVNITARPVKPTCMDCAAPPMKILPQQ